MAVKLYQMVDQPLTLLALLNNIRSSHPEVVLVKGFLKLCSKFTGEHPCRSVISIKLQGDLTKTLKNLIHGTNLKKGML